jgi:hypothetical protein
MPRNVRNFWVTLHVDGRETPVETGPRAKDGGFKIVIQQRENGGISNKTFEVIGRVLPDGLLQIGAYIVEDRREIGQTARLQTVR